MSEWEEAWADFVSAEDAFLGDWSGEDYVPTIGRMAQRFDDAKRRLRLLDPVFCGQLGIV